MKKGTKRYTLDGKSVDIIDFIADNEFTRRDIQEIADLRKGEEIIYGGGAAAEFVLRRVK